MALAIDLATMCKQLQVLPRAGGLFDQDWYHHALLQAGLYGIMKLEEKKHAEQVNKMK